MGAALGAALLVSIPTTAQEMPLIVGTIPNRADAVITLTLRQGSCPKNQYVGYTENDAGRIMFWSCWFFAGGKVFMRYDDGNEYTYPVDSISFTPEFLAWLYPENAKKGNL